MSDRTLYRHIIALLFVLFSCVSPVCAQFFELTNSRKQVNIRIKMVRNMVIVKLHINDKGPYNFILDTGVGIMIITEPTLIDSLNIHERRTIKLAGVGTGEDFDAYVTSPLKIDLYGITSNGVGAAIFKKDHFGLSNYAGMPIHGLLGYDFFNRLTVKLNFTDSMLTAYNPGHFKAPKKYEAVPLMIEHNKPYITIPVKFCDSSERQCKLIVDIGAGHSLSLDNNHAKPWPTDQVIAANLGMGLTGPINGGISRVTQLKLGKYGLSNVLSSFPDAYHREDTVGPTRDGNLGMTILKRFTVIFDYQHNQLYLKPRSSLKEPFEHDMSGLEYYAGARG